MEGKTVVRTENAPAPFQGAPYSQAIRGGGFVYVAGQLGLKPGDTAMARVAWTQWCSSKVPTAWEIQLPGNRGALRFSIDIGQDVFSYPASQVLLDACLEPAPAVLARRRRHAGGWEYFCRSLRSGPVVSTRHPGHLMNDQ